VKRRVEAGYLRSLRKPSRRIVDNLKRLRKMQRSKGHGPLQDLQKPGCNQLMLRELWAAVNDAMPHDVGLGKLIVRERAEKTLGCLLAAGEWSIVLDQFPVTTS